MAPQEIFTQKFSAVSEQEKEFQLEVEFEYLTKKEMAEEYDMTPSLNCIVPSTHTYISWHEQPRDEISERVKAAEKDPERKIRSLSGYSITWNSSMIEV